MFRYPSCNLSTYDRREFPGGTVYNGDCLDVIKTLPESSVDCIVTDPPYFLGMTHNGQKGNFRDLYMPTVLPGFIQRVSARVPS